LVAWLQAPANVSSNCDELLDQLNDVSFLGNKEFKDSCMHLRWSLTNLNRSQGLGFLVFSVTRVPAPTRSHSLWPKDSLAGRRGVCNCCVYQDELRTAARSLRDRRGGCLFRVALNRQHQQTVVDRRVLAKVTVMMASGMTGIVTTLIRIGAKGDGFGDGSSQGMEGTPG
jgi:hypothetical protein